MTNKKMTISILGAGISGLSIAYALQKRGIETTIYEKKAKAGGVIQTYQKEGWLVEGGPNTMLIRNQQIWDFLDELNLNHRITEANDDAKKRYIVRDGRLHAVPDSLFRFFTTNLISTSAKFRLLKEPFIPASAKEDESIARFIKRRLGSEPLDYGVNPFVAGVYAGDPEKLSIRHTFSSLHKMEQKYGSIVKSLLKKDKNKTSKKALISFDDGLQVLPQTLAEKLGSSLKLKTEVQKISKISTGWKVVIQSGEKLETREHSVVISTLPAHQLPGVYDDPISNQSIQKLSNIEYAPISVIALGFKKNQIKHPLVGFGMLIPEKEPFDLLGCLFSSSLFPNRAPRAHALLTCFIGGTRKPKIAEQPGEKLLANVLQELNQLLNIRGEPVFSHHTYWPKAIPQFNVGYDTYLKNIELIEQENSGLFLAGNFVSGVSVPDCILSSFETAKKVELFRHS